MHRIAYRTASIWEIDHIRPHQERLNEHSRAAAIVFISRYGQMSFCDRRSHFMKRKEEGGLRTDLAMDPAAGSMPVLRRSALCRKEEDRVRLYCGSFRQNRTVTAPGTRAPAGREAEGAVRKRVSAGAGNASAGVFCRGFGFFARMTVPVLTTADSHPADRNS